jgi:hypothetical protein
MSGAAWAGASPFGPGSPGFQPAKAKVEAKAEATEAKAGATQEEPKEASGNEEAETKDDKPAIEAVPASALAAKEEAATEEAATATPEAATAKEEPSAPDKEVDAVAPVAAAAAAYVDDEPITPSSSSALPWLLAGGLAIGGVLFFMMSGGDEPKPEKAAIAASATKDTQKSETPVVDDSPALAAPEDNTGPTDPAEAGQGRDAGTSDTGVPAANDETAADTGAAQAPVPEPEPEPAVEAPKPAPDPAPAAKKKKKTKKTKKPAASSSPEPAPAKPAPAGPSADELLSEARKASLGGNQSEAYKLAKQSYTKKSSTAAAQIMALSACKMGDKAKAKAALKRLPASKHASVKKVCEQRGVDLG